jgi:hypothetical protein
VTRSTFPLRLSDPALREAVREVAEHEHLSQNEYIEQAIRNDLVVRGRVRAQQLEALASRLATVSDDIWATVVERSLDDFASGEVGSDPVQMHALHSDAIAAPRSARRPRRANSVLEDAAAFRAPS